MNQAHTPELVLRFYDADQQAQIESRRKVCLTCDENRGLTVLTVKCRSCGCAGVALVSGRCRLRKWP